MHFSVVFSISPSLRGVHPDIFKFCGGGCGTKIYDGCRVENNCPLLGPKHWPSGGGLPRSTRNAMHCLHQWSSNVCWSPTTECCFAV